MFYLKKWLKEHTDAIQARSFSEAKAGSTSACSTHPDILVLLRVLITVALAHDRR